MMGLASHISCISDAFSSYCVSFSSMTCLTMMGLGPGHLVRALFHLDLAIKLVVSVVEDLAFLVKKYFTAQNIEFLS